MQTNLQSLMLFNEVVNLVLKTWENKFINFFFTTFHLKSQFVCQCLLYSQDLLPFTVVIFVIFIA